MSKIARYQGNVRAFASDARGMERTVFGGTNQADDLTSQITASFLRGWGIVGAAEHPSLEDFNAAMYAMSQFIAYQHQMGVPEWHAEQEYHIGSICTHNGESYQSLQNANVGSQPPSEKWTPVLTSKNGLTYLGLGETAKQAAGAIQKSQNGADIPNPALFRQNIGVYDASTSQKGLVRLNGGVTDESNETAATSGAVKIAYDTAIAAAEIAKKKWSAVDATISQKGIVMLSDNTGVPDSTTAATTTAVNYVLNQAAAAYSLAESKYTAGGATTGKAGLVQLVNSMGGSGSLVMPQAAVTTAIQTYPSLGKGQNLQDLRGSRSIDATYTNSTGFPIAVYVRIAGGTSANLYVHVNGIEFGGGGSIASNTSIATAFFIVPNGATYRVIASGSSIALQAWSELR
ncbi:tail fiber protein [Salmonella enterica]|nr:tail fiber protein [Salmonella enterica]EIR5229406.1 tail fiber protein [Salmonella enterica]EKC0208654.1 tail fiber protein [Salmonella enterica]EKI3972148.1 tail fiber protein [Salmonella enterica]EKS4178741.1 tail fiber protein [Salmonella enterica]